jgi:hypothetical protein
MDLALNKTLAGKKLPEGSQIISAVNEGEDYQLTDLDPSLVSRFNVYYFAPTPSEWLLWAAGHGIDKRIIGFIEKNPDCLDGDTTEDAGLNKTADRRSWERVSELIANMDSIDKTGEKIIAGAVGVPVSLKFTHFLKEHGGINPQMVLLDFEKYRKELERLSLHELTPLNEGCFRLIELESDPDIVKHSVENLERYIKWLEEAKRNEALAHWTTLFDSTAYPKAKVAIMTYSPYIFQSMVSFIRAIKV